MHISYTSGKRNKTLWQKYLAGDKSAFGELYSYYHKSLTAFCLSKVGSLEIAENAASDTLIKLLQYPNPEDIKNFENWIFTVAKNVCLTYLTKAKNRKGLLKENYKFQDNHEPEIERKYSTDNLDSMIRSNLDSKDYKIWQLHQQGYENYEIAEIIGINEKTVANRKSAARKILKDAFKQLNNE